MNAAQSCPDRSQLETLLGRRCDTADHAALIEHLDRCQHCQATLEQLAAGPEISAPALAQLGDDPATASPGLNDAIDVIKLTPPKTQPPHSELDFALDFLEHSDNPAHLGRFGPYEVTEELGRGGMGVVLKGLDPALHRVVAIKVLAPALASVATARTRFAREARAAAAVTHDHVVTIHAVDEARGLPYLVMQYVSGVSLQEKLDRTGPLQVKEILRIGMQIASGLAAAHAQGLVHRDIKPSNILLENGVERVKITDFGLARTIDDATVTQSGVSPGTPQYMSPEQARGEPFDHRTDLFSLGSVIYAMCTGVAPFRTESTVAILRRVSDDHPRPIRQINPDIPAWLAEIVTCLHAKDPAGRYQTAAEVAQLLGRHLEQLQHPSLDSAPYQGGVKGGKAMEPPSTTPVSAGTHHRTRWLAAACVALVAATLTITEATGLTEVSDFVATVLRIRTTHGTLVVKVDDPAIQVTVEGEDITLSGAGTHEIHLTPGKHQLQPQRNGQPLPSQWVTVTRGGKQVVSVSLEAAPPAGRVEGVSPLINADEEPKAGTFSPLPPEPPELKELAALTGHRDAVNSVAFSPDRTLLASGSNDKTIRIWDVASRTTVRTIESSALSGSGDRHLLHVRFSPDGTKLVVIGWIRPDLDEGDVSLEVWDVATGKPVHKPLGFPKPAGIAVSEDGGTLAVRSHSGVVTIRNVVTGNDQSLEPPAHGPSLYQQLAISSDGKILAIAYVDSRDDEESTIGIYSIPSMQQLRVIAQPGPIRNIGFAPDDKTLVAVTYSGATPERTPREGKAGVHLWDISTGELNRTLQYAFSGIEAAALSPDGRLLAVTEPQGRIRVWNVSTGQILAAAEGPAVGRIRGLDFSPDGQLLASGTYGARAPLGPRRRDGKLLAAGTYGGPTSVQLWDVANLASATVAPIDVAADRPPVGVPGATPSPAIREVAELPGHLDSIISIAFSPNGNFLATASYDETARIWDLSSTPAILRHTLEPTIFANVDRSHTGFRVGFSQHGKKLYTFCYARGQRPVVSLAVWQVDTGAPVGDETWEDALEVALLPGSDTLVLGAVSGAVTLIDLNTGREETLELPLQGTAVIRRLAISPDGEKLAIVYGNAKGGGLNEIKLFDRSGNHLSTLSNPARNWDLAFSPDSQFLATAGIIDSARGSGIKIWHVPDGSLVAAYKQRRFGAAVRNVAFRPDGELLAACGGHQITVWPTVGQPESTDDDAPRPQLPLAEVDLGLVREVIHRATFSPDGNLLASAGAGGTVKLWDVAAITEGGKSVQSQPQAAQSTEPIVGIPFEYDAGPDDEQPLVQRFYDVSDLVTVPAPKLTVISISVNKEGVITIGGKRFTSDSVSFSMDITSVIQDLAYTLLGDPQRRRALPHEKAAIAIRVEQGPRNLSDQVFQLVESAQRGGFRNILRPRGDGAFALEIDFAGDDAAAKFLRDFKWFDPHPPGSAEHLMDLIKWLVESETWDTVGGPGSISYVETPLHRINMHNSETAHQAVRQLLEALSNPQKLKVPQWRTKIEQQLEQTVAVDVKDKTLGEVVAQLREQTGVNLTFRDAAMESKAMELEAREVEQLQRCSLRTALTLLLEPHDMAYLLRDQAVLLTEYHEAAIAEVQLYRIDPLLPRNTQGEPVLDRKFWTTLLEENVEPESWDSVGGPGIIRFYEPKRLMMVEQPHDVQRKVAAFLQEVQRQQRGGGLPQSGQNPANATDAAAPAAAPEAIQTSRVRRLPPWRQHIEDGLTKRVDTDFKEKPLDEIAAWLRQQLDANVVLDTGTLAGQGINPQSKVTLRLNNVPLDLFLAELLDSLRMDYLLRNEALVLTTSGKVDAFIETQVYSVAHLLPAVGPAGKAPFDPKYWQDLITTLIEPGTWSAAGGRGVIMTHDAKALLIISQTQSIHRKIATLLEDMKSAPAPPG